MRSAEAFPKSEKIRRNGEFSEIIQTGRKVNGHLMTCFYRPAEKPQIGFATPKRLGRAVERNRARRRMREVYRFNKNEIGPIHLILLAKPSIKHASWKTIESEFRQVVKQTGSLN
jgi:ribonuclease P protein component